MGTVHKLSTGMQDVTLGEASAAYLATLAHPETENTRRVYGNTYRVLARELGAETDLAAVTPAMLDAAFTAPWAESKPATWDTHRGALRSLLNYCEEQGWIPAAAALIAGVETRKLAPDRDRACPASESRSCSPASLSRCVTGCSGGCCTKPALRPARSSAWTCPTWTRATGGPASLARAAPRMSSCGRPAQRGCCRGTCAGGRMARCS